MVTVARKNIPDRFKDRDRWLMWDNSSDTPRRPHWKGDFGVSWNDPADWHTFEDAFSAAQERKSWGIGYVFQPDDEEYMIDIDGPYTGDGDTRDWFPGLDRFTDAGAYMEWSPSGNGVHIPVEGQPPEWWSDCEVPDTEHQGVDVLTNKFCTFTGDELPESGGAVTSVNAAPFLYHAHKNITGDAPRLADRTKSGSDMELSEDDVKEALNHVDESLHYSDWLRVGFAVYDWDSGSTGKRLFEQWSRSNSKWEADRGQRHIDDIWDNDSPRGDVTVGTLIHFAKEGGWEPPSPSKPEPPDSRSTTGSNDTTEHDWWKYVRETYQQETNKAGRKAATEALEHSTDWMYVVDSETLWVYDSDTGYFDRWGEETAHRLLERELGTHYSQTEATEIIGRLQARNQTRRKELNARTRDSPLLCVGNGVVNLETGELLDHDPDYKFTRGLRWDYEPAKADPEPVRKFLDDVTEREADRDTILDHLAHGLMPGHPYRAFVIMYGPGSNGKTRLGKLLRGFVGEENAASVELQDLTGDDQFATGGLPGAFVNVGDDISVSEIRDTSILKSLTGDGTVRANEKYEKQYEFENEAAMFFSANEPPRIREQTAAISDRLYPIEMPYRFVDDPDPDDPMQKEKVPGIAKQLVNDDAAMRGLLLLAVKHAQDVIERNGQYSMPEGPAERRERYEAASDPIKRFALTHMEPGSGSDVVLKADAYTVYTEMCDQTGERAASADVFKQQIGQLASIDLESTRTRKLTPGDDRSHAWKYVQFADSAKEYMPDRLLDRYYADESAAEDRDTSEPPTAEAVAYNATPITQAAQTLTGYVTVTAEVAKVESLPESTTRAILKDESGAIDLLTWADSIAGRLEDLEGETVVIEDAEVGEHEGTRQLQVVDGLTEIRSIQPGVGHTEGPTPETDAQLTEVGDGRSDTAADGGTEKGGPPDDAEGTRATAERLAEVFRQEGVTGENSAVTPAQAAGLASDQNLKPNAVATALEYGATETNPALFQRAPETDEFWLN